MNEERHCHCRRNASCLPDADLPEQEKQSDRAEADRVLALLVDALAGEDAAIERHDAPWRWSSWLGEGAEQARYRQGGRAALVRAAARLGVHDLHERAQRLPREEAQP